MTRSMWRFRVVSAPAGPIASGQDERRRIASASSSGRRRRGQFQAIARSLFVEDRLWPLPRDRGAGRQLGEGRRDLYPRRHACRERLQGREGREFRTLGDVPATSVRVAYDALHPLANGSRGYGFAVPLLDGDHVTDDTGTGFVHTAPGHGRDDFDIWMANARGSDRARHRYAHPLYGRCGRLLHRRGAGLRRASRVIDDKGNKGDANEAVIKALIEAGNLVARGQLEASISAFVAVEEAGHFPQHAAMVHRARQADPQWWHVARDRARRDRRHALVSGRRREPHPRHDRRSARLGDLAPARLGRADRGLRQ